MGLANASLMDYRAAIRDQKKAIKASDQSKVNHQALFQLGVTQRRVANGPLQEGEDRLQLLEQSVANLNSACQHNLTEPTYFNNRGLSYFEREEFE